MRSQKRSNGIAISAASAATFDLRGVFPSTDGTLEGVEAVIDKDHTSSVLACAIGVERIVDLTSVEHAKL